MNKKIFRKIYKCILLDSSVIYLENEKYTFDQNLQMIINKYKYHIRGFNLIFILIPSLYLIITKEILSGVFVLLAIMIAYLIFYNLIYSKFPNDLLKHLDKNK